MFVLATEAEDFPAVGACLRVASDPLKPAAEGSHEPFPRFLSDCESPNHLLHHQQTGILFDSLPLQYFSLQHLLRFLFFFNPNYRYSYLQLLAMFFFPPIAHLLLLRWIFAQLLKEQLQPADVALSGIWPFGGGLLAG